MKICTACKVEKSDFCFYKKGNGLSCYCKNCKRDFSRKRMALLSIQEKVILKEKTCNKCKKTKDIGCFYKHKYSLDGNRAECKLCSKENNSSDKTLASRVDYRAVNKDKISKYQKERYKEYYKNPSFKLRKIISKSVRCALIRNYGSKQGESTFNHLPYTAAALKEHIESQWEPWMNWDNYGKYYKNKRTWQIDHIEPQSKLPYDSMSHPNFYKCWALSNLRPLDTVANIKKGNKSGTDY